MTIKRPLCLLTGLALAATTTVGLVAPASATGDRDGPGARTLEASAPARSNAVDAPASLMAPLEMPAVYPSQPRLKVYPDGPDASDAAGLLAHHDLAPQLNKWMKYSNRISTQVVGQSTQGRDLYLVTVTAPETKWQARKQESWRNEIREDPSSAMRDKKLKKRYKQPIWFSANIHGNEWEGTDASMSAIEELVTARGRDVRSLLRQHRIYFSLTLNPDGRNAGTRATALGLNENRDMITATTPEGQSFIRTTEAVQPLLAADLHGYTGVLQVEPCGPPHGVNYEYDLFISRAYQMARKVERDVVRAEIPGNTYYNVKTDEVVDGNTGPDTSHIKIPYRDTPSGWDDFPPIFTAQYAAYSGAVATTVELPLSRPKTDSQTPENARVNVAVGKTTIESMIDYVDKRGNALLRNQAKVFQRGLAGDPKTSLTTDNLDSVEGPNEWKKHWDPVDDQEPVELPRAYVIPVGADQRSSADADRLVEQLLFHEVRVGRLKSAADVGSKTYPAGSYVVDMHQPKRGLANSLLDLGVDISAKVPTMYDISAWSLSYLWGATVDKVGSTTDAPLGATDPVRRAPSSGTVPATAGDLTLDLAGVGDYQALNALLEENVSVFLLADGSAVVPTEGYAAATTAAQEHGATFTASTPEDVAALGDPSTKALRDTRIAYSGVADDSLALAELGFDDLKVVDGARLSERPSILKWADVLWVGAPLKFGEDQERGRKAVKRFVARGNPIVGHGTSGFQAAQQFGLVNAEPIKGNPYGNGIVAVDTPAGSLLAAYPLDHAFIYPALAFDELGAGTTAAQSYDAEDPFLAGHWLPSKDGVGPDAVAGLASAVTGESESGARAFVFGTSVVFRTHTRGQMSQAARAIFWAVD